MNDSATIRWYSPFWAVWVVFLSMTVLYVVQINSSLQQRKQLKVSLEKLAKGFQNARTVNATMVGLGTDLSQLAEYSNEARQIVKEFGIQIRGPSSVEASLGRSTEPVTEAEHAPAEGKATEAPASANRKK